MEDAAADGDGGGEGGGDGRGGGGGSAWDYEYRKVRQPAVCCRTSVALSILPSEFQTLPIC
jgi:hypothetical protein